jgi:hypothetical protein
MILPWPKYIDHELILLESLSEYYEKHGRTQIRRAELKELCDDRLYEKTDGRQAEYGGGTFQSTIKKLEEKLALKQVSNAPKKTLFTIDIKRIKSLLLDKKYGQFLESDNTRITDQELPTDVFQKITEDMVDAILEEGIRIKFLAINLDDQLIRRSHQPLKEAAKSIGSYFVSTQFDFIVSHEDKSFKLDDDAYAQLAKVILMDIVRKSPKKRFKLVIEYKGLPYSGTRLGLVFMPALFRTIMPKYFVQWAKQVHNYDVPNEDIYTLQNVTVNFLNQLHSSTKMLFNIFFDSLKKYFQIWSETVDSKQQKDIK